MTGKVAGEVVRTGITKVSGKLARSKKTQETGKLVRGERRRRLGKWSGEKTDEAGELAWEKGGG